MRTRLLPVAALAAWAAACCAAPRPARRPDIWTNYPRYLPIRYVVVHATERDWRTSLNALRNPNHPGKAHYLVRADGGITPLIAEKYIARACGNSVYNAQGVSVEVEGYALGRDVRGKPRPFTDAEYVSAARITAAVCRRCAIPTDHFETRAHGGIHGWPGHILGHDQVPNPSRPATGGGRNGHHDPGPAWDWVKFMHLVRAADPGKEYADGPVPARNHALQNPARKRVFPHL